MLHQRVKTPIAPVQINPGKVGPRCRDVLFMQKVKIQFFAQQGGIAQTIVQIDLFQTVKIIIAEGVKFNTQGFFVAGIAVKRGYALKAHAHVIKIEAVDNNAGAPVISILMALIQGIEESAIREGKRDVKYSRFIEQSFGGVLCLQMYQDEREQKENSFLHKILNPVRGPRYG